LDSEDELDEKIKALETKYNKGIKIITSQIDSLNKDIAAINNKLNDIGDNAISQLNEQINSIRLDIPLMKDDLFIQTNLNLKISEKYLIKQFEKMKVEYDSNIVVTYNKFDKIVNEIKCKLDSSIMNYIEVRINELKLDQDKSKEEIKSFVSIDLIEKMNQQIKIIKSKLNDDPLISKTKLEKCASC
jgi:hypothetical protein